MTDDRDVLAEGNQIAAGNVGLSSDVPISRDDQDRFGRAALARRIEAEARSAPQDGGFVIALCGAWGSGKTSVANLAMNRLRADGSTEVVAFNPWMFSGVEDLVLRVFEELSATLGKTEGKARNAAKAIAGYAEALSSATALIPVIGQAASIASDTAGRVARAAEGREPTLHERRARLETALRELDRRIVVFLDDLDRLTDDEIRDVVRLVKSVGDLPNLSYVLAFDREHVEDVLGAGAGDGQAVRQRGRRYLEKIIQVRHDVPPPRRSQLVGSYLTGQLRPLFANAGVEPARADSYVDALRPALDDMVTTPRDAKRLANAVAAGLEFHADEVAAVDIVGLEALRTLEPEVHGYLGRIADILLDAPWAAAITGQSPDDEAADRKRRLMELLDTARSPVGTLEMLRFLFPAGETTLGEGRARRDAAEEDRENRVAIRRVFWRYVHASIADTEVSSDEIAHVAEALDDPHEFARRMASFHDARLIDLIPRLSGYWRDFRPENIVPTGTILLEAAERFPAEDSPYRHTLDAVTRYFEQLMVRLVATQTDRGQKGRDVRELFRNAPSLSARWRILFWFGRFRGRDYEGSETRILTERATMTSLARLCDEVLGADPAALAEEVELPVLLEEAVDYSQAQAQVFLAEKANHEIFLVALIGSLTTAVHTRPEVVAQYRFDWNKLVDLLGEGAARAAVIRLDDQKTQTVRRDARREAGLVEAAAIARGDKPPPPRGRMIASNMVLISERHHPPKPTAPTSPAD